MSKVTLYKNLKLLLYIFTALIAKRGLKNDIKVMSLLKKDNQGSGGSRTMAKHHESA